MWTSILIASSAGLACAAIFSFLFTWTIQRRLWNLEIDVAEMMERHVRKVRSDAAKARWDEEGIIDEALKEVTKKPVEKKRWTKWPSSDQSENSSQAS